MQLYLLAQAAVEAAPAAEAVPVWMMIVGTIMTVVAGFVTKWVNKLTNAKADKLEAEAAVAGISKKEKYIKLAEAAVLRIVASLNAKELPKIAKLIRDGQLKTKAGVKKYLRGMGSTAKVELIAAMSGKGIDVLDELGDATIDHIIRKTVDDKSPVMGETARTLLQGGWKVILDQGKTWLKSPESGTAVTGDAKSGEDKMADKEGKPVADADDEVDADDGSLSIAGAEAAAA
jgi:hypothetical protein